jgi:hypothetical protein
MVSCAPATKIATNKAGGYTSEPKRVFVVTDVGTDFGDEFYDAFQRKLTEIIQDCGAQLQISRMSTLELDPGVHLKKMKAFNADTMMTIRRNGGTKSQYGLYHVIYDVRLIDVPSDKTVWRANTNFYRGGTLIPISDRGEVLAVDVTNSMKQDRIFSACPVITPKK